MTIKKKELIFFHIFIMCLIFFNNLYFFKSFMPFITQFLIF